MMTVRELITALLEYPMDAVPYVGKGMGPVASTHLVTEPVPREETGEPSVFVILDPVP